MQQLHLPEGKAIYLASDFHLGWPSATESQARERKILQWIEAHEATAERFIFLGDIFDFWFEHRRVIPRGAARLQGKIAQLTDQGIPVTLFTGNHDLWMKDYLSQELGVTIYHQPQSVVWNGIRLYLAHGDGLGPGDKKYKFLKKFVFQNTFFMFIFEHLLHPNQALGLAHFWSDLNKRRKGVWLSPKEQVEAQANAAQSPQNEWLWQYAHTLEKQHPHDFYVFGHRHIPLDLPVGPKSRYLNLGEWLNFCTYAVFDGQSLALHRFTPPDRDQHTGTTPPVA
ncbi:MAG: UDP-2,3-diacylglucosamine diphosphatase [Bernardetiaceae bacterium]